MTPLLFLPLSFNLTLHLDSLAGKNSSLLTATEQNALTLAYHFGIAGLR